MSCTWPQVASVLSFLKKVLCSTPVLTYLRFDHEFVLEVDASLKGLGACMSQVDDDGMLLPVAFTSHGGMGAERNYLNVSSSCWNYLL